MAQITLKQLRYFVAAGELQSVTRAAEQLYVSQPSISAAISHIEMIAGIPLFIRHHAQGLSLTNSGDLLLKRARALLADADSLLQFTMSMGEEIAGPLHMGAFTTFAHVLMPFLMKGFNELHPKVKLRCDERHQADLIQGVQNGKYDLAFGYDLSIPSDIDFTPLYQHPPYAIVGLNHPLASREEVSLHALSEYEMVLLDWPLSRDYFAGLFSTVGVHPEIAHRVSSVGMARELVAQGFGFTLLNVPLSSSSPQEQTRLKSLRLKEKAHPLTIGILAMKGIRLAPAAEAMKVYAAQHAAETEPA